MTLKTSCLKCTQTKRMFWQTIKKNSGITILIAIGVLLYCPGLYLVRTDEFHDGIRYYADSILMDFVPLITVFGCMAVILFNIINFSFLYSKRSSDVFHAFPLKRSQLLLSRFFAGFISAAIPVILGYISAPFISLCFPSQSFWGAVGMAANSFLLTMIAMLLFSAVSLIFIVCSGSIIDFGISFFGTNIAALIVGAILYNLLCNTLTGFSSDSTTEVLKVVSPLYYCANGIGEYLLLYMKQGAFPNIWYCLICSGTAIISIVISVYLYKHRKAEMGGQGYAYRFIFVICSALINIAVAYALGVLFSYDSCNTPLFWIFAFVGALVSAVILGAVTDRGFKTVKKSLILGAASALALLVFFLGVKIISPAYTSALPDMEKISAVSVGYQDEEIPYSDAQKVLDIHKSIVEKQAFEKAGDNHYGYANCETIRFTYVLENGRKFKREFSVVNHKAQEELSKIVFGKEREQMIYNRLSVARAGTLHLWSSIGNEEDVISVYIKREEMKELFRIYFAEARSDETYYVFSTHAQRPIDTSWSSSDDYHADYYYLYVNDSFKETYAYVESFRALSEMQNGK